MTGLAEDKLKLQLEQLIAGKPSALARTITAVENQTPEARYILKGIQPHIGNALVVGFTGPPGAGKSTLINAYVRELRNRGKTVCVLAVDPSSPISGGAILGDRIRMAEHTGDAGVFVRSLASRGHLGGLSRTAARVLDVMDASGRDVIVIETVGAGQSEVEIAGVAGTKVVVCAPGLGDDIQAIKAGILEIADVLVVNKSDMPQAENTKRQLRTMLHLRQASDWNVPVLGTVATTFEGLPELADTIDNHDEALRGADHKIDPHQRIRRVLAETLAHAIEDKLMGSSDPALIEVLNDVQSGELNFDEASQKLLEQMKLL
ncbi:MAG: methylmalonyl Co-A mutase-associated GTPase MeaB [Rhodospirillales bacterium]|nr:methylmalonyl Co-A mutase-associated GTPase MeaB [Rhodospirillales bacterium]